MNQNQNQNQNQTNEMNSNANTINFEDMSNKELNSFIADNNLPKPKGRPNKDALIAHIQEHYRPAVARRELVIEDDEEEEDLNINIPANFPANQICRDCGVRPIITGESLCAECWTDDAPEEEEPEMNECDDCGVHFDNEGDASLRFCENCDDHHPHTPSITGTDIFGESSSDEGEGFGNCETCDAIIGDSSIGHHTDTGAICAECDNNTIDEESACCADCEPEPIFNGDRCPVCLDEECSTFTDTCEHMLCGGCFDMLPEKQFKDGWAAHTPFRECPICRSIVKGVKAGQSSDTDKIREWRELKKQVAEYEAGKARYHIRERIVVQERRVVVNAEGVDEPAPVARRRRGTRANAAIAVGQMNAVAGPERPAGRNDEIELEEGQVLGDLHFDARPRLRCCGTNPNFGIPNGQRCRRNTRRVCPGCRNNRLCLSCGDRCPTCEPIV